MRAKAAAIEIEPGSWTLVLLPDTQVYAGRYPQHYDAQTQWIADHVHSHNIRCVLHEGDITNKNIAPQWDNALHSMQIIDRVVPYVMAVGNHDYNSSQETGHRYSLFNDSRYFGPGSKYATQSTASGFFEPQKTDSSFHTFSAGGRDWLVVALEWAPRDEAVDWANKVVQAHPDHLAMLVTHAYMYNDDTRYHWAEKRGKQRWSPHAYRISKLPDETVNDGQQLWEKLISRHKNFRFVFSGHVLGDGTGFLSSIGEHGNVVHQMLANYQFKTEGGQGDLRLLEFKDDGNTVVVRTYSPVLDRHDTAADQQFVLKMDEVRPAPAAQSTQEQPVEAQSN